MSSVYRHQIELHHDIDYKNAQILDRASNDYRVKLKEKLYIDKLNPTLNIQQCETKLFCLLINNNNFAKI